jgi:flavin-dependent dehydrogenase
MYLINDGNFQYDVIVIGSGPAGIAAAISCKKANYKVLLVTDKSKELSDVNSPVESVHPGLKVLMNKIGAASAIVEAACGKYTNIKVFDTYNYLGEDINGGWEGFHINKNVFIEACLKITINQGVDVKYETKVVEILSEDGRVVGIKSANGELYFSKFVIDCSGKRQIAGKKMKLKKDLFSPHLYVLTGIVRCLKKKDFKRLTTEFIPSKNGWLWIAPFGNNCLSWTSLTTKKEKNIVMREITSSYGESKKIVGANLQWRLFRPTCSEGLILCGDAAGLLDPASGQGIFNAVLSGMNASICIQKCLTKPLMEVFFLADYDSWFSDYFVDKVEKLKAYYQNIGVVAS